MEIHVEGAPLLWPSVGIRRYALSLLHALCRSEGEHRYLIGGVAPSFIDGQRIEGVSRAEFERDLESRMSHWLAEKPSGYFARNIWKARRNLLHRWRWRGTRREDFDLFLGLTTLPPERDWRSTPTVATVHDLLYLWDLPGMDDKTRGKFTARHPEYVRTARHVIAVSEWTRTDIIEKLGVPEDRVSVVPNAVDERFRPLAPSVDREALRRRLRLPERFLLHVGTLQPRKNLARLIRAHRALLDRGGDVDLVLCGQDAWLEDEIIEEAASPRSRGRVQIRRDVHDDDLVGVYNLAEVFVMPSLLEGFGIPVLEAMACGTPVVSSHAGALAEVAGDAAILIDPEDEDGLSKAIQEVLDSPDLRERLRARGLERAAAYSWDASAAELARILDEIDRTDHGENS